MRAIINKKTLNINDIKPHPKNPKKHNDRMIEDSISEIGYADPIVVDENNVLLSGHGRIKALRANGYTEVDVQVIEGLSDEQKEKLLLSSNRMVELGGWDKGLLNLFDKDLLKELKFNNVLNDDDLNNSEIDFSTEVLEANNYIVFVFDNVMDWNVIESIFELKSKDALDSRVDYRRAGIGRVVNGKELLRKINENKNT